MNRKEFVKSVAEKMRRNNIKKPVSIPKRVYHISDDDGNSKDFFIKTRDKSVQYTIEDIDNVLDVCIDTIQELLKNGDFLTFRGFGNLSLVYRKPRTTKLITTGEPIEIEGRFVPKFTYGNDLRMCARVYELSLKDREQQAEYLRGDGEVKEFSVD